MNPMQNLHIDKIVVHMAVGEAGEKLVKAETILKEITGQQSVRTIAKRTQPAFGIRKGQPIGCKVYLRGEKAEEFVRTSLEIIEKKLFASQFDKSGNISYGIEEHTDFPTQNYDPMIGIYGMDVNVILEKKGVRIARRSIQTKKLPEKQRVTSEEAIKFMEEEFGVEVQ
ncbi:50S ribosomal protein L5 [Methanoplanus sp. FWC-SCC4]|uniref:Large ribosomal subunit protein uL5 n=1 Tax=Methanochimaera problematica TaxID=2609417 RepID=A0AA97F9X9_9EURY|nr:50S ribosomal protein L5 [Methanoplanus sp. FWC-SCC4]WOF15505.1 50S ribosomal protein L5 [Methanoplanus sp. FWC-SCC4]